MLRYAITIMSSALIAAPIVHLTIPRDMPTARGIMGVILGFLVCALLSREKR